jgi:hypothetical protein
MLSKIFAACQGRHTAFTVSFFIIGNILHWFHKLDGTYIGFMSTLMAFVLGHSVSQSQIFVKSGTEEGK